MGRTLGWGAFSEVKLCYHKETGKKYAVKIMEKKILFERREKKLARDQGANREPRWQTGAKNDGRSAFEPRIYGEVQLLMRLMHPNIIKLHQYTETQDRSYMIMDYAAGGELVKRVLKRRGLPENCARDYFRKILSAVDHCHLSNVVHRDIKLENILLSDTDNIIMTDFGFGRLLNPNPDELLATFCGTPNYAAAELVTGTHYSGVKSDVWSLGVVLFFMTAGRPPFVGKDITSLYTNIKLVEYTCPPHFSPELRALLSKIFVRNPAERISIEGLRHDPWVNMGYSDLPMRVMPVFCAECDMAMNKFISGIVYNKDLTTFTFYKFESGYHYTANAGVTKPVVDANGYPNSSVSIIAPNRCSHQYSSTIPKDGMLIGALNGDAGSKSTEKRSSALLYDAFRIGNYPRHNQFPSCNGLYSETRKALKEKNREMFFTCRMSVIGSISANSVYNYPNGYSDTNVTPIQILENNFLLNTLGTSAIKSLVLDKQFKYPTKSKTVPEAEKRLSKPIQKCDLTLFNVPDVVPEIFGLVPTLSEIKNWHAMHKPPREIRNVPFPFFLDIAISGTPHSVFRRLYYYVLTTKLSFSNDSTIIRLGDNYIICCKIRMEDTYTEISAEVLKILLAHKTYGILFKRINGDITLFKLFRSKVINLIKDRDEHVFPPSNVALKIK